MANLPRQDVTRAFPDLDRTNPGFSASLPRGEGPVVVMLARGGQRLIYRLPMPDGWALRRANLRLVWPFLRDMTRSTPAILRWLATKDPACRARVKRHLRLNAALPSRSMQRLLFLADSLADMPDKLRSTELARLHPSALGHRSITVILPIHNALDLLPEVLDRVLRHTDLPWRLILIEDASTDPALRPFLRGWVAQQTKVHPDRITLIEHNENKGFIRSVNTGLDLALAYGDHVVLLNSDALVPKGWASRLMRPFLAHDRVATVTPMSNDAEIFSAPVICQRSSLAPGEGDAIDEVAARIHPDAALADAPTGVGFCMAMSIDYLRRIPQFDTVFGRGYGEEVDWCQKARAIGGRHLGLANLFVEHRGGTSFGSKEKQRLICRNGALISRRYPGYDADVQRFIADDPLVASRLALAIVCAAEQAKGAVPLYLAHNMGGGAEDYLVKRIADGFPAPALVLRVGTGFRWQLELHSMNGVIRGGADDLALIRRLLEPVKTLRVIYSCGVGDDDPAALPDNLLALLRGNHDSIEMLIHDFLPISPSYTLLDADDRYAGPPSPASADAAHRAVRPDGAAMPLAEWQAAWGRLIDRTSDITVFSASSAEIFATVYPMARDRLRLVPHQLLTKVARLSAPAHRGRPVIGVLGNIGLHKGAGVLQDLSQRLDRAQTATLVVLGRIDPRYRLGQSARVHGGYQRGEISVLAQHYGITDWLIPSIWPETFSYTTHEAIATGLPVWCFGLGAQADAIAPQRSGGVIAISGGVPDLDGFLAALLTSQTESAAA